MSESKNLVMPAGLGRLNNGLHWIDRHRMGVLCAIGLLALALRVATVAISPSEHYIQRDTLKYVANARAILKTGLPEVDEAAPLGFSYLLMPFLAVGMNLGKIAYCVEPVVGALDCVLAYVLCCRFGNRVAGILAAFICAVHPALINGSSQILTEDWTIFCTLLSLVFTHSEKRSSLIAAGLLLGFACTIRSPCLGMLLGLAFLWTVWGGLPGRRRAALLLLGASIPILLVSIHLSLADHRFVFLTRQSQTIDGIKPVWGGYELTTEQERSERKSYLQFALQQPAQFVQERMMSFMTFASPWPFGDDRSVARKMIFLASDGSTLLVLLISIFLWWRRGTHREWFVLLWLPVCLCAFYTMFFSIPRYRLPIVPLLIVFGALVLVPHFTNTDAHEA